MERRSFFKRGSLAVLGSLVLPSFGIQAQSLKEAHRNKRAKNIIFMVSDGMSFGTLVMADLYLKRKYGRPSSWMGLYESKLGQRAVMDMASASSVVTDSSAASSSWGGGVRVNNGSLNISPNGQENMPILQKFKKAGKKVGCVTTVMVNHATPAGFCTWSKSRNAMDEIALNYTELGFDVMLGGGSKYFDPTHRKDQKDLFATLKKKGYTVARTRNEMLKASTQKPLYGLFAEDALPYSIDRAQSAEEQEAIPTLAEMTAKAIEQLKGHSKGFVMQVEGGKVDWAAHANDIGALLYDQVAFDEAVKVALDFAKADGNTLVVITSYHGNANPGLIYGKECNNNFDRLQRFTHSNDWVLQKINANDSIAKVKEHIAQYCGGMNISEEQAKELLGYYAKTERKEDGLYNYKHLPYRLFAELQKAHTSVGWISMDHSSDYTELAMYGPGSEKLSPFMRNTDMHQFLLEVAEVSL